MYIFIHKGVVSVKTLIAFNTVQIQYVGGLIPVIAVNRWNKVPAGNCSATLSPVGSTLLAPGAIW